MAPCVQGPILRVLAGGTSLNTDAVVTSGGEKLSKLNPAAARSIIQSAGAFDPNDPRNRFGRVVNACAMSMRAVDQSVGVARCTRDLMALANVEQRSTKRTVQFRLQSTAGGLDTTKAGTTTMPPTRRHQLLKLRAANPELLKVCVPRRRCSQWSSSR